MRQACIFISVLYILMVFQNCSPISQKTISTTEKSSLASHEFSAFNKELIIEIKGDSIAGYAFIAEGSKEKETIILIAGYPGNDTNFDIAQTLRRNGYNVIQFNHRGAWGSQGTYSYSNCLEDVSYMVGYLSQANIAEELRIDTSNFTLLGRSYGGGIALIQGSKIMTVNKIIAISSVNYGDIMNRYSSLDELSNFKKYMQKQIMINTEIDVFLQEMLDNKSAFEIVNYNDKLKSKKLLLIEDTNKNEEWINKLDNKEYILLESDHNFIDNRLELSNLIVDWIQRN